MEFNQLLQQFLAAQDSPATKQLQQMLQNGTLQQLSPNVQAEIQKAAAFAAQGNQAQAMQSISHVLATKEGAALAAQICKAMENGR